MVTPCSDRFCTCGAPRESCTDGSRKAQPARCAHRRAAAPAAAADLLALMHAQGEVERLSEREQLLSSLLVSVNAVLWAIDWETRRVLYVSPAYERLFGRSAGLLLADHREWRNSVHPEDLDYAEHSLARVLEQAPWRTASTASSPLTGRSAG